ncbi:MAG: 50S ribosomal protein L25 [Bdellovibrionota bacterium]
MKTLELDIKLRDKTGTTASKQYRRNGQLPAVLYSGGKEAKSVLIPYKDFFQAAKKSKTSQVFTFRSENSELNGKTAVVRDLQRIYTKEDLLHVDFQLLEDSQKVKVRVPLVVSGTSVGVKNEGGVLQIAAREITVFSLPKDIPSVIDVDVTPLNIGDRTKTGDLNLPEGVSLAGNPEETVVSVVSTRTTSLMTAEADTEGGQVPTIKDGEEAPAEAVTAKAGATE